VLALVFEESFGALLTINLILRVEPEEGARRDSDHE